MVKTKRKGGFRPGSGRKSGYEETRAVYLASLGVEECIKALKREGEYASLPVEVRLDLAARFAVKAIPQKIEGAEGLISTQIIVIRAEDGNKTKTISGRLHLHRSPISSNGVSLGNGQESLPDSEGSPTL